MKGSDIIVDSVDGLRRSCHEINLDRRGSYIDSPDWRKNKGETIT